MLPNIISHFNQHFIQNLTSLFQIKWKPKSFLLISSENDILKQLKTAFMDEKNLKNKFADSLWKKQKQIKAGAANFLSRTKECM